MARVNAEYYMGTTALTGTQSARFPAKPLLQQPHLWEVRVRWTAGTGGTVVVSSRPIAGTSATYDVVEYTFTRAATTETAIVHTLCENIIVALTQGTGATASVEVLGVPQYDGHRGQQTFETVTAA